MAEEGVVAEQEGVVGVGVGMEIIKTMAVTMVDTPTGAEVEAEAGVGGPIVVLDMKEAGVEGAEGMAEVEEGWVVGVAGVVVTRHSQGISVPFALAEYAFA